MQYCASRVWFRQAVGILGAKALAAFSPYKRHKHPDTAQQRFPDLSLNGKLNPPPVEDWSPTEALVRGQYSRTMVIQAGTSCGGIRSIPPKPSNQVSR